MHAKSNLGVRAMRPSTFATTAFLFGSALILTACGGGGGGGGGGTVPFTSWNDIAPNSSVRISGSGKEASYTSDVAGNVASIEEFSDVTANVTVRYDSNQEPTRIAIATSQSSVSWDENQGDGIGNLGAISLPGIDAAISNDLSDLALSANPFFLGYNYQTFGVWVTGAASNSGRIGALSVGSITPGTSVPNVGTATYLGELLGFYIPPDGTAFFVASADVQVDADFLSNSLDFQSSNTLLTQDLQTSTPASFLNLNGTLVCCGGSSEFSGTVNTSGGLAGNAEGSFYGPNAEELGGSFALQNGLETYVGSFGAVQ